MTPIELSTMALVVVAILPLADFIYRYHRYSPYKLNPIGRTLMRQKWALLALLSLTLSARLFGDYWGRTALTMALFLFLIVMFYWTDFDLRRIQKENPGFDRYKGSSEKKLIVEAHKDNDDPNRLF